jgi:hypothetical protein
VVTSTERAVVLLALEVRSLGNHISPHVIKMWGRGSRNCKKLLTSKEGGQRQVTDWLLIRFINYLYKSTVIPDSHFVILLSLRPEMVP